MPGNMLFMDTNFPAEKEGQSLSEQVKELRDYNYVLLEQLRYAMGNLGVENFNNAEITRLTEMITEPIQAQIEGEDGSLAQLALSAEGLALRISDLDSNYTALAATVSGISLSAVSGTGGSTYLQLSNGSNSSTVALTLSASDGGGQSSTLQLKSGSITLASANITFSGLVTFSGLSAGTTTINGGCITTGTLSASKITTGTISADRVSGGTLQGVNVISAYNSQNVIVNNGMINLTLGTVGSGDISYGQIYPDYNNGRMYIYAPYILKLESAGNSSWESTGGALYLAANGDIVMTGSRLMFNGVQVA